MNSSDPSRVKIRYAGSIDIQDSSKKSVLKAKAIFDYSNPLLSLERKKPTLELDKQINKTSKSCKEKHVRQYKISFAYTCTSGDNSEIINPQITNLQRLDKMTTNSDHQFVTDKLKPVMSRIVHRLIQEYKKSKSNYQQEEKEEKSITNAYTFSISTSENPLKGGIKTDKFSSFSKSISPYLVNSYTSKSNTDKNYDESVYPSVEHLQLIKSNSTIKGTKTFIKHNSVKQIKRIQKYHSSYKLDSSNTEFGKNESFEIVCCGTKNFIHPKLVKDTFLFKKIKIIQAQNVDWKKLIEKPSFTINEITTMNSFDSIETLDLIFTYSSLTYNICCKDVFKINLENLISYRRNIHFSQFIIVENTKYYEAEMTSFTNFICIVADLESWSNFRKLSSVYDSNFSNEEKDSSVKSEIKSRGSTMSFSKKKKNPFENRASTGSPDMFERTNTSRRLSKVERVSILQRLSLNAKSSMTFLEAESVSSEFSVMSDCPVCHGDPIICLEAEGRQSLIENYVTLLQESDGIAVKRTSNDSIDMKDLKMLLYNFMAKNDTYPSEKIKEEMIKRQESMMKKLEEEEEELKNADDNEEVRSKLLLSKPNIPKGEGKNPNLPQQFLKSLTKKVDEFKSPKNDKKPKINASLQNPVETLRKSESFVEITRKTIIKSEKSDDDDDSNSIKYTDYEGIKNLLPREHYATATDISTNVKEVVEYIDSDDKSSKQYYLRPIDTLPSKSTENSGLRTDGKTKFSNFGKAASIVKEWLLNIQPILKEIEYTKLNEIPLDVLQNLTGTSPVSKGELFITRNNETSHFLPTTHSTISHKRPIVIHSVTNQKNTDLISESYESPNDENKNKNKIDQSNKKDLYDNFDETKERQDLLNKTQIKNQLNEKERNGKLKKSKEESTAEENISSIPRSGSNDKISKKPIANKSENKKKTSSLSVENENSKINSKNPIKAEPRKSLMKDSLIHGQTDQTKNEIKAEPRKSLDKNILTSKESKENVTNSKNHSVNDRKISITKIDLSSKENNVPIYYEKSKEFLNADSNKLNKTNDFKEFTNEPIYVEIETKQNNEERKSDRNANKETVQIVSPVSSSSNSHEKRISTFDASISQVLHEPLEKNTSTGSSSSTRSQATSDDFSAKYTNESPELKKLFNKISWENSQSLLNLLKFTKSSDIFENGLPIKIQFSETKSNKSSNVKHVSSSFKGSFNDLNKKNETEYDGILPDMISPDFNERNRSKSLNKSMIKEHQFRPSSQNLPINDGYYQPGVRHITDPLNRNLDIHHLGDQINGLPESLQVTNHLNYQTGSRQISNLTNQQLKDIHDIDSMYRYTDGVPQNGPRSDNLHYQMSKQNLGDSVNLIQETGFPNNQPTNRQIKDNLNYPTDNRYLSTDINQTIDPQNRQQGIHQFSNHRLNMPYSPEQTHIHQKSDILNHQNDIRGMYYPSEANNLQMEIRHLTDPTTSHFRTPITHNVEEFSSQKLKYQDDFNISRYQPGPSNKEIDDLLEKLKAILSKSEEFLQILSGLFSNFPRNSNTITDTVNIPKDFYLLLKSICENKENEQENHINNESFNDKALNKICKMLGLIDEKELKKNKKSNENFNDLSDRKKNNEVNQFFKDLIEEGKSISEEIESNTYSVDINESFINKVVRCVLKKLMETNPIMFKDENSPSDAISARNSFLSPPKKESRKPNLNDLKYQILENGTDRKPVNSKMKGDNKFDDYYKKSPGNNRKSMNIASIIEDCLPNESKNIINGKSMEKKTLNSLVVCDEIANRMKSLLTEVKQSNKIIRPNSPKDLKIPKTSIVKLNQTENLNLNTKDSKMIRSLSANCLNSCIVNPNPFASRHTVASIQNMVSTPYQKQKMNSGTRNIRKEIKDKSTRIFLNSKTRFNNNMITNCNKNESNQIQTKSLTRNSNRKIFK